MKGLIGEDFCWLVHIINMYQHIKMLHKNASSLHSKDFVACSHATRKHGTLNFYLSAVNRYFDNALEMELCT